MNNSRLVIVTGASRGIGRSIALALARAGFDLAVTCLSRKGDLDALANDLRQEGAGVISALCDVSDDDSVGDFFDLLGGRPIFGLVNNAAYTGDRMNLVDAPIAQLDQVLATNFRGTILMCRYALDCMDGAGAIVNLSSQSAMFGANGLTAYAASKAAINGLTISLAREVAPRGVRVNAISPGPVLTEALEALPASRLDEMQKSLPMGRFATGEDIANAVVWLMSDNAAYVNGAIIPVHGAR